MGTNLVHELRNRGHEVIALDQGNTEREEHVRADVRNYRQLEKVLGNWDFDFVYHLAAEYGRWNGEDFFSSAEVYGDYEGVMTEDVMEENQIRF